MDSLQTPESSYDGERYFSPFACSGNAANRFNRLFRFVNILTMGAGIFLTDGLSYAIDSDDLEHYEGWCIVAVKKISGYWDENKGIREGFEGCSYGRLIIFEDGTFVRCLEYGYQYEYRPTAILMSDGASAIMIVGDELYDVAFK